MDGGHHIRAIPRSVRLLLAVCVIASAVLVPLALGYRARPRQRAGRGLYAERLTVNFRDRPAPPFRLRDARGGVLDQGALRGRPYLITFPYTHCRDTCPLIGAEIRRAFSGLGTQARRVNAVGISVDPTGDTSHWVRWWLARLHEPANFHYLVGTRRQLVPVWDSYFIDAQLLAYDGGTHTSIIYLVDGRGIMRGSYNAAGPIDPKRITHDLRTLLAR